MIGDLIWMAAVLGLHFLGFLSLGTLLLKGLKRERFTLSMAVVTGYFLYFGLFELIALPMVFLQQSLTRLTMAMGGLMGAAILAAAAVGKKEWLERLRALPGALREHSWMFLLLAAAVLFQCYAVAVYSDTSADAAFYVGMASTAVYTDTLEQFSPYTGAAEFWFHARYVFSCFPLHNAFLAKLTGLPAIIQAKTVMPVVNVLAANLIYYQTGLAFFKGKKRKADLMAVFLCLVSLCCDTLYQPGTFFFTRLYEGKGILANLVLPMIFYCGLRLYQDDKDWMSWVYLFLCCLAAVCFSGSSLVAAAACTAAVLPTVLLRRRFRLAGAYLLCMLPILCWYAAYYLARHGIISMRIR